MKNHLQNILSFAAFAAVMVFCGIGVRSTYENTVNPPTRITVTTTEKEPSKDTGWQLKEPSESAEFISGPLAANVGELCVFRLNDPGTKADWIIVPPATCYIDSSGSSLAFASNVPSKYSIVAAIVEDGVPKILMHVCEYGVSPEPSPNPSPTPTPTPNPTPTPQPANLGEWIKQSIPDAGRGQCAALTACYEAAADGIEKGSIKTPEAAFSVIRTATQTKIKPDIWGPFLDQLSGKINEKLDGNTDVKKLGTIFSEIANGLKAVSDTGDVPEDKSPISEALILPQNIPVTNYISPPSVCSDPTGKACQPQPTIQYRRAK